MLYRLLAPWMIAHSITQQSIDSLRHSFPGFHNLLPRARDSATQLLTDQSMKANKMVLPPSGGGGRSSAQVTRLASQIAPHLADSERTELIAIIQRLRQLEIRTSVPVAMNAEQALTWLYERESWTTADNLGEPFNRNGAAARRVVLSYLTRARDIAMYAQITWEFRQA